MVVIGCDGNGGKDKVLLEPKVVIVTVLVIVIVTVLVIVIVTVLVIVIVTVLVIVILIIKILMAIMIMKMANSPGPQQPSQ